MNLLAGAKLSGRLIFSSPSSTKHLFYLRPISALQHCNFYSTKATSTTQKTQQLPKPRIPKSSVKSSVDKQSVVTWPKPHLIPYQAKVANFVTLIGSVKVPARFETDSDGRHFTTTVISLGDEDRGGFLSIPIVFGGELAHVVACHVKVNDRVFVSGQLSADPLSENLGKFHVVAENINFVEGFEKKSGLDRKTGVSFSGVKIDQVSKLSVDDDDDDDVDDYDVNSNQLSGVVEFDSAQEKSSSVETNAVPLYEAVESGKTVSSVDSGNKKKDANQVVDLWKDLVSNPSQWWDYRGHKANGLVKEKFPDFKQKGSGEALWISGAQKWILRELEKLEFDVKEMQAAKVSGGEGYKPRKQNANLDNSWKDLVENPGKWWDNRAKKNSPKAPDFRHKETGEALWLNSSPEWALSKLPPAKGGQNATWGSLKSSE